MESEVTKEELKSAETIAKAFYQTLAGKEARHVLIAMGLILRCIVEERMTDAGDEDERDTKMGEVMDIVAQTLVHPSITRKAQHQ